MLSSYIFYILAFILIVSSLLVVFVNNMVYSLLSLLVMIFTLACLFLYFNASFVALAMLLFYISGLAICFVFVLMMGNIWGKQNELSLKVSLFTLVFILLEFLSILVLKGVKYGAFIEVESGISLLDLANGIFIDYAYAFMILGAIMLTGSIGIISFVGKKHVEKLQNKQHRSTEKIQLKKPKFKQGVDIC